MLMERLRSGNTTARLVPGETASQFVRDVGSALNAEVEKRIERMVATIDQAAQEHYDTTKAELLAKVEEKARSDATRYVEEQEHTLFNNWKRIYQAQMDIALDKQRDEMKEEG
jgi:hypothetical protein